MPGFVVVPILLGGLIASVPEVRGAGGCPTAGMIAARLAPLLAGGRDFPAGAWLQLRERANSGSPAADLEVTLMGRGASAGACRPTAGDDRVVR